MFATGEPRSGTTLMHALMSVDPHARALRFWEVMYPSPPPGTTGADDPHRARADADWREINAKMPKWLHCHPYNDMLGNGLPEDERTWAFDFRVMTPTAWWRVPMQTLSMGLPTDPAAQYSIHKAMLQQFQYGRPKKYWALKGFHGFRLQAFFDAYPDANLVWLHRDPVQVVASRTMMMADILDGIVGPIDLQAETRMHLAMTRASIANTLANPLVNDPRILHVRYTDFVADPVEIIRRYYKFCGRPLTTGAEMAMRNYLKDNRGDRYGKFQYSTKLLTDIDENIDALHEEFAPFRERFGVAIEKRGLGIKMHNRISVHSICFPAAGIEELCRNWRELGTSRVTFSSLQVLDYGAHKIRDMLNAAGQRTETVAHVFRSGPLASRAADMRQETGHLARAIDAAATLGARSIYMLTGGRGAMGWEDAATVFSEAIAPCLPMARDAGVALSVENTSPFHAHGHIGNNLRDTITLAEMAEIGVCIDYFACWTEAGMRQQITRAMPRCVLVQVSDYVLGDRALPCRAVPGDGTIPWPDVLRWLLEAGYTGAFDLELLGPRIDQEGLMAAITRAAEYISKCLRRLGPEAPDPH